MFKRAKKELTASGSKCFDTTYRLGTTVGRKDIEEMVDVDGDRMMEKSRRRGIIEGA